MAEAFIRHLKFYRREFMDDMRAMVDGGELPEHAQEGYSEEFGYLHSPTGIKLPIIRSKEAGVGVGHRAPFAGRFELLAPCSWLLVPKLDLVGVGAYLSSGACPVCVEELAAWFVGTFIGMSAEVVALGLQEVRWEPS